MTLVVGHGIKIKNSLSCNLMVSTQIHTKILLVNSLM